MQYHPSLTFVDSSSLLLINGVTLVGYSLTKFEYKYSTLPTTLAYNAAIKKFYTKNTSVYVSGGGTKIS
jgi:hypothetical protein